MKIEQHSDYSFKPLTLGNLEKIRIERNKDLSILRTSFPLTEKMQKDFFENVINNKSHNSRYYAIYRKNLSEREVFIGMCGLENIQWENRRAEISIILNNNVRKLGYGEKIIDNLLFEAFYKLNLEQVWGECYTCNKCIKFWEKIINKYKNSEKVFFGRTKFWEGKYYDSMLFAINREEE